MIKFKLIILILCCITHLVTAETAFDLIDIGISAESIAIGSIELGCQTAQCLFTNPALLDNKVNWSLDTFQVKTVMDNYIRTFSLSKSYQNYVIGIGYNGTSIEGIQEGKDDFIEDQMEIDYHSYQYGSYYLSGKASIIDNFSMGLNLKYKEILMLFNTMVQI